MITSIWSKRSSPEGSSFFIDAFRFMVDQLGKVGCSKGLNEANYIFLHNICNSTLADITYLTIVTLKSGSWVTPGHSSSLGVLSTLKILNSWSISESPCVFNDEE